MVMVEMELRGHVFREIARRQTAIFGGTGPAGDRPRSTIN